MRFFSLDIYAGLYDDFLEKIKNPEKKTLVFTPNPEILVRASKDDGFTHILKKAHYLTPDGTGLYTASLIQAGKGLFQAYFSTLFQRRKLREKYGELIRGSDLTHDLIDISIKEKRKVLLIDNYRISIPKNPFEVKKKLVQETIESLFHEKFPSLQIEVIFDGENTPDEIATRIEKEHISYVFSCIGMKTQEQRLIEIFSHLSEDTKVVGLGVGSSFDYLLGLQERAPVFLRSLGLEWLYRLVRSPRERWKRIHTALVVFPSIIKKISK